MHDTLIFGAGGLGRQVLDILHQAGRYRPVCFLDSDPTLAGTEVAGVPVRGGLEQLEPLFQAGLRRAIVAIGDNFTRVALAETLVERGFELISAIHPLVSRARSAEVGPHAIIGPRATICVHACIGPHVVMGAGAIAEHDNVLGRGVFLGPAVRLAGGVRVQDFARLEIGATVIPGRTIGTGARVAAGTVVIRDVPPNRLASGVPAVVGERAGSRFVADGA